MTSRPTNHITYAARNDQADMLAERMERGRALGLDVEANRGRRPARIPEEKPLTY